MRSCAIDWSSGVHKAKGALHAASRVSERRLGSRSARKNELLFCSNKETGMQARKSGLDRNMVKKLGQDWDVKLLPREVSKGEGKGVGMILTVGLVDFVSVGEDVECEFSDVEEDAVARLAEDIEANVSGDSLSCRSSSLIGVGVGGSRVSMWMRPSLSSSLKCKES